jgi:hypothetical protein
VLLPLGELDEVGGSNRERGVGVAGSSSVGTDIECSSGAATNIEGDAAFDTKTNSRGALFQREVSAGPVVDGVAGVQRSEIRNLDWRVFANQPNRSW